MFLLVIDVEDEMSCIEQTGGSFLRLNTKASAHSAQRWPWRQGGISDDVLRNKLPLYSSKCNILLQMFSDKSVSQ